MKTNRTAVTGQHKEPAATPYLDAHIAYAHAYKRSSQGLSQNRRHGSGDEPSLT